MREAAGQPAPTAVRDPGSFRDPAGHVHLCGDAVYRSIHPAALAGFLQLHDSGLLAALVAQGQLIGYQLLAADAPLPAGLTGARGEQPARVLRHPKLPFWSYPYEWTFGQLKDAALAHLALQVAAFDRGAVLSDATPYNLQFVDGRAVHIDLLSLRPWRDGEPWLAYNAFCRLFLLPLLLEAWTGLPFQPLLRARLDGIELGEAARLLPWRKRWLSLGGLLHVSLHARAERAGATHGAEVTPPRLSPAKYRALLTELQVLIAGLQSRRTASSWRHYEGDNSYTDGMQAAKQAFVVRYVQREGIASLWDIGGNSGDFSLVALQAGARHCVLIDGDLDSLERAWLRAKGDAPGLLPLVMDVTDPSPARGWRQQERKGLQERAEADGVLALALIHHLVIGRNIPLASVLDWLLSLAPAGVIEFVPKADPMVVQMLRHREDRFADYDEDSFRRLLAERAQIVDEQRLADKGRLLVAWRRHAVLPDPR